MNIDARFARRCLSLVIAAGMSGGIAVGCDSAPVRRTMVQPDIVDVLHTDSTTRQSTRPGMLMAFDLPGHAGTGYAWRLLGSLPSFLEMSGDPVFTPADPDRMGSSGLTRFLVKATGTGKATLVFEYVRGWEKDAAPVRTARVEIESGGGG